jgi:hypothetical protein
VIYTGPFRARGDFTDLMGRASSAEAAHSSDGEKLYLSREPGPATMSAGLFVFEEQHVAFYVHVRISV